MPKTPRQRPPKLTEFEKTELSRLKREAREREAWTDNLRSLGSTRRGLKRDDKKVLAAISELIPKLADLDVTYEALADLSGLSRARVGQILTKHRKENPPPAPVETPDDNLVAAVDAL